MYCSKCGKQMLNSENFCLQCGSRVGESPRGNAGNQENMSQGGTNEGAFWELECLSEEEKRKNWIKFFTLNVATIIALVVLYNFSQDMSMKKYDRLFFAIVFGVLGIAEMVYNSNGLHNDAMIQQRG